MFISEIKAKSVFAGPGQRAYVAEAKVYDGEDEDEELYVTVQMYDGMEFTVSKQSVYACLAEDNGEPADEVLEEYEKLKDAKGSKYGKIFSALSTVVKTLS